MDEIKRLEAWMVTNDQTISSLARAIGMSYDGVYQILHVRERMSPGFKLRFLQAFGANVAAKIFDAPPVTTEPVKP